MQIDVEGWPNAAARKKSHRDFGLSYDNLGWVTAGLDALAIIAVSVVTGALYHQLVLGHSVSLTISLVSGLTVAILLVSVLTARGTYAVESLLASRLPLWSVLLPWLTALLVLLGAAFLLKVSSAVSRGALLTTAAVGPPVLLLQRALLRRWFLSLFDRGQLRRRRVVVVTDQPLEARSMGSTGCAVVRAYALPEPSDAAELSAVAEQVLTFVRGSDIDEVHIAMEWQRWDAIKTLSTAFRALPLPVRLMPDKTALEILRHAQGGMAFAGAVELQRGPMTRGELHFKRGFDLLLATAGLFLLAPLLLGIALAIRLDSAGPILFRQSRRGFNGRTFRIYKFRSMSVMEDGAVIRQAKAHDARVTRVGRLLRKSSLDELPQLLNVLRGDMSLVGPRPHALAHDDEYTQLIEKYAFRHHVRPGITGWAQVNGYRGETPTVDKMERRVEFDLWYITTWSFWLDVWILLRTGVELVRWRNAF
jgi:Undecaprenyl-phosphate glucose phosphotransferase